MTSQDGVTEPLLEKSSAAIGQESADRRGTITLLLHYSSYDLPLLLLAFSAGEGRLLGAHSSCNVYALLEHGSEYSSMAESVAGRQLYMNQRIRTSNTICTQLSIWLANAGAVAALGLALIPFYTGRIIDYIRVLTPT